MRTQYYEMKAATPAFSAEKDGLIKFHCHAHGYLTASAFHASSLNNRRHACKECIRAYDKKRYNASTEYKMLECLRVKLRKTNPTLAKMWEVTDVAAMLSEYNTTHERLTVVHKDITLPLTPDNACLIPTHAALGRHHLRGNSFVRAQ